MTEAPELIAQLFSDPASFEYPGGESLAVLRREVQRALDQLLILTNRRGTLVAHGGVCRAIIGGAFGDADTPLAAPRATLRLSERH